MNAFSPAAERNKTVIGDQLAKLITGPAEVLEIGSGTGQHALHCSQALPQVTWQCSDRPDYLPALIDNITQSIEDLKSEMDVAHQKTEENLKFIKENLFNPHEGLWAETKQNTQFRENANRWRTTIGAGFVGLFFKQIYDFFG